MAQADVSVRVCHDYGCLHDSEVTYSDVQLREVRNLLRGSTRAEHERARLAEALGRLYAWAGEQSPIHNDKGGDYADGEVEGRMDCIDHAITTTRLLHLIADEGWLRYHRVLEPARRTQFIIFQHFSAVIEDLEPPRAQAEAVQPVTRAVDADACGGCWAEGNIAPGTRRTAYAPAPAAPVQPQAQRFVVDTWFRDNGQPAVLMPIDTWMRGAYPNE